MNSDEHDQASCHLPLATCNDGEPKGLTIHMLGVCGVGMAGLAVLLKDTGHDVTGCDLQSNSLTDWLSDHGIQVSMEHDISHITEDLDLVIRSRAVPDESPEVLRALEMGIPVLFRGEVLPRLLEGHTSAAVSGTHGKTSTSAFIVQLLRSAGRKPSWFVGSECDALPGVASLVSGAPGPQPSNPFVVEADESDGTAALYEPDIAVVTNIDFDHMEHFADEDEFRECFRKFAGNAKKCVICCGDDKNLRRSKIEDRTSKIEYVWYGTGENCSLRAVDIRDDDGFQRFRVELNGEILGEASIPFMGRHNVLNTLAAVAVCMESGLDFKDIAPGLAELTLPARRYEVAAEAGGIRVISDYAHHPAEIRALIDMAEKPSGRLLAVFQPHRYTRTFALGDDFPPAFEGVDELVLCPVYAASEKPIKGGTIYDLYERWQEIEQSVKLADSLEQAWGYLKQELKEGDTLLVVGAGDVDNIARWAAETTFPATCYLQPVTGVRRNVPLAAKSTWKAGGSADYYAEVEDEAQLRDLMKFACQNELPLHILGGGSNILVSDLGVRGVTVRLKGEFSNIESSREKPTPPFRLRSRSFAGQVGHPSREGMGLVVGAGVSLAGLLGRAEENGLAGLEFLEGVPGSAGGAVRMNAGAQGHEISECVSWIRCLKNDGNEVIFRGKELEWEYRCCPTLKDHIVIEVGLYLDEGDPAAIRQMRSQLAEKRKWMKGLYTAGSTFKNPDADEIQDVAGSRWQVAGEERHSAGQLIDQAGLKGRRVGGASVCREHGNFIVTEKGASASDVRALIEIVRAEVFERFGVRLEEEVQYLG